MASSKQELGNKIVWGYIREQTDKILDVPNAIKSECLKFLGMGYIESSILTNNETQEILFDILSSQSIHSNIVSGVSLLHRASRDGFDAFRFRSSCMDKKNLLTIIQSKNNHIFGAYAMNGLCKSNNNISSHWIEDNKAFLFLIQTANKEFNKKSMPKIYKIDSYESEYAVKDTLIGLAFGGGFDLFICDQCNVQKKSYCKSHGDTYNIDDGAMFCGSTDNWESSIKYTFLVKDFELFQLLS